MHRAGIARDAASHSRFWSRLPPGAFGPAAGADRQHGGQYDRAFQGKPHACRMLPPCSKCQPHAFGSTFRKRATTVSSHSRLRIDRRARFHSPSASENVTEPDRRDVVPALHALLDLKLPRLTERRGSERDVDVAVQQHGRVDVGSRAVVKSESANQKA